jgi:hypothetical protein
MNWENKKNNIFRIPGIVYDGVDDPIKFHAGLTAPEAGKIGVRLIVRQVVFMVYF